MAGAGRYRMDRAQLDQLLALLVARGLAILGPRVRDGAIVYDPLDSVDDLPIGWTDEQAPGRYRLLRRQDDALFGYAVGPHSWRRHLQAPEIQLWTAERVDEGFEIRAPVPDSTPQAFLGVRGCELAAIRVQDRVLAEGEGADSHYATRRAATLLVAVECGVPAATCFCPSMGTGPSIAEDAGADITLTELDPPGRGLVARGDSPRGAALLEELGLDPARAEDCAAAGEVTARARERILRSLDQDGARRLAEVPEHGRWDDVAGRCLACTNCTMVCPTCFCTDVSDRVSLEGATSTRERHWDSCFTSSFSTIHGGTVRDSTRSRYRQWLTHKVSAWWEQFGTSGCVGCGRCITWCPPGIDLTEEVRYLLGAPVAAGGEEG